MASFVRIMHPAVLAAALLLTLAACSTGGAPTAPSAAATAGPTEAPSEPSAAPPSPSVAASDPTAAATVAVASSGLGDIVVDAGGRTLYLFTKDTQGAGTSVCNGDCAASWPPLLVADGQTPTAGEAVTGEVGTATRDDGTTQVTLNGWPLYYFAADTTAGDTNGQGLNEVWFVVSPAGEAVAGASGTDEY